MTPKMCEILLRPLRWKVPSTHLLLFLPEKNRSGHLVRTALREDLENLSSSANHSGSSGLARSLALSFSRVAAARRIPVLPDVLQRNSGFLARARHARGNDRKIRPSGRACHYLVQDSIGAILKRPLRDRPRRALAEIWNAVPDTHLAPANNTN